MDESGHVIVQQVQNMQPVGHWVSITGETSPTHSKPGFLKKFLVKWLSDLTYFGY